MMRWVSRDEREASVDLVADRLALLVVSYGLLAIVAYRSFALQEAAWDLLGLLVASGVVGFGYRAAKGVTSSRLGVVVLGASVLAAIIATAIGFVIAR
jgi:hypothetical protein